MICSFISALWYWAGTNIFSKTHYTSDSSGTSFKFYTNNVPYVVLPSILTVIINRDDIQSNSSAIDARFDDALYELLQRFLFAEQNIAVVEDIIANFKSGTYSIDVGQAVAATRSAPSPVSIPLGYGSLGVYKWRQQYVLEDRYFGVA